MCIRVKNQRNKGFSLIEVVVAMTVLAVIFVSTMMLFQRLQKTNEASNDYQHGQSFGNTLMDSLSTCDYSDIEDYASGKSTKLLSDDYTIEDCSNDNGTITMKVLNKDLIANVTVDDKITDENIKNINTIQFPSVDSLNAEETYVVNLSGKKAVDVNVSDNEDYDEQALQYFLNANKAYIAELTGLDSDAFYTTLTEEDLKDIVTKTINLNLDYIDGYTIVKEEITYEIDENKNNELNYVAEDDRVYTMTMPVHQQVMKNLYCIYAYSGLESDKINFHTSQALLDSKNQMKVFILAQNASYITGTVTDITLDTDATYKNKLSISYTSDNDTTECMTVFTNSTVIKSQVKDLGKIGFKIKEDGNYQVEKDGKLETDNNPHAYDVKKSTKMFNISVQVTDKNGISLYSSDQSKVLK